MPRPLSGFELVEHTADVGIRGWGRDLAELLTAMARGLFEVITDPARVIPAVEREVRAAGDSPADLLHEWLDELNALHQLRGELYTEFTVETEGHGLRARVRGEAIDPARHDLRLEVKAVTWHGLEVTDTGAGYEATVLLDI